ncbi:NfeD family protein [Agathobaculum sp. NTUH-O15-33]|uniref:NfeD family protein n=1 Tax=Agathobaculum sp. NTUH-O15-33 TaxID=3079302 RepID=UPI0029585018|nr:NfeD family protein [Agathobaculum sp. NTUH-O15-33]WNX86568.1 NfeD family protein [Agathobaculum sp. NTUH-O15-33]
MIFGINSLYIWTAVIIIGVAVEAFTLDLSAIWFAVGSVAALVAASIGLPLPAQLLIFVLFSAALLILVRPFCRKFLHTKNEPTNADRIIGEPAIVVIEIDNVQETGEIKVFGQLWSARSVDDSVIPKGAAVRVTAIRGVKAIVEKV